MHISTVIRHNWFTQDNYDYSLQSGGECTTNEVCYISMTKSPKKHLQYS